jgi:hypothetical protein
VTLQHAKSDQADARFAGGAGKIRGGQLFPLHGRLLSKNIVEPIARFEKFAAKVFATRIFVWDYIA